MPFRALLASIEIYGRLERALKVIMRRSYQNTHIVLLKISSDKSISSQFYGSTAHRSRRSANVEAKAAKLTDKVDSRPDEV